MQAAYPPALRQATQWPAGQQECLRLLRDRAGIIGFAQDANAYVQPVPAEHFSDLTRLLPVEVNRHYVTGHVRAMLHLSSLECRPRVASMNQHSAELPGCLTKLLIRYVDDGVAGNDVNAQAAARQV